MTSAGTVSTLNIGDSVPIGTVLANLIIMGIVTDINNPNMFAATLQAFQSKALLTVPVLQGVKGNPGQPTFALRFQNDTLSSPSQLPTNLTNEPTDLGKYWVFGATDTNGNVVATTSYVWYGTSIGWKQFPVGSPGPPGPYSLITPNIVLMEPGNGQGPGGASSWVQVTGPVSNPTFTFYVAAPQGIPGPSATLGTSPDVDFSTVPPTIGDMLVCSSRVVPGAPIDLTIEPSTTGGEFSAGEYFWVVTAVQANGAETMPSNEVAATLTGSTSSVALSWTAPGGGGAVGYKVYRGNSVTQVNVLVTEINSGSTTTYTDIGTSGTPGQAPSAAAVAGANIWVPVSSAPLLPKLYTVPASAFSSVAGIGGTTQTVCTFAMPQQPFPWKPFVFAQLQIFGANISFSPLLVGAEVLLGHATAGTLVAKGIGNSLGAVTIIPQASTSTRASQAMTPTNGVGLVPQNHTGTQGNLYANLVQQGMAGTYDFSAANAQMVVLAVPCPTAA